MKEEKAAVTEVCRGGGRGGDMGAVTILVLILL